MLMHEKACVIPIVVYRFYCMTLYHSQTRRHVLKLKVNNQIYQTLPWRDDYQTSKDIQSNKDFFYEFLSMGTCLVFLYTDLSVPLNVSA